MNLKNYGEKYTSLALHPFSEQLLFCGTQSGKVFLVKNYNIQNSQLIYKGEGKIRCLSFRVGGFLAIACEGQFPILWNQNSKKIVKCEPGHSHGVVTGIISYQQYLCSFGTDGCINVYKIFKKQQQITSSFLISFKTCISNEIKHKFSLNGSFKASVEEIVMIVPGLTTLQQIYFHQGQMPKYSLNSKIYEKQQILKSIWMDGKIIITSTNVLTSIWNERKGQKIYCFGVSFEQIIPLSRSFVGIVNNQSIIYEWKKNNKIEIPQQQSEQPQENNQLNNNEQIKQNLNKRLKKPKEISVASKLLLSFPQSTLQRSYQQYNSQRFLFINEIGCVIQREQGNISFIELQYHNKSKIRRIKFQSSNKSICHFALNNQSFVYSTQTHLYFENQRQIKQGFKWDAKVKGIQSLSLGTDFLAVVGENQIQIFDFGGNIINMVPFDRQFVAIATYQDIIAITYHVGPSMWKSQGLAMRLYKINKLKTIKFIKESYVEIEPTSLLKWFSFSEEGMLFSQDSFQNIRIFNWENNQWIKIFSVDRSKQKIYIQNIHKYVIYGFKVQQKEGYPTQPTVMPRTLPRKIQLIGPSQNDQLPNKINNYNLNIQQSIQIKKLRLQKYILIHEQFRYDNWYKCKYGRTKDSPYYNLSLSIMSMQQINKNKSMYEQRILSYIRKYLQSKQFINENNKRQKANILKFMFSSFAFTDKTQLQIIKVIQQQTKEAIMNSNLTFTFEQFNLTKKKRLNQINNLQTMINQGWYNCELQSN